MSDQNQTCSHCYCYCRDDGKLNLCGAPAMWRYPKMGGGYAYLCDRHAQRHMEYAEAISMERVSR